MRGIATLLVLVIVLALVLSGALVYHDMQQETRMLVMGLILAGVPGLLLIVTLLGLLVRVLVNSAHAQDEAANEASRRQIAAATPSIVIDAVGNSIRRQEIPAYAEGVYHTEPAQGRRMRVVGGK